jgi:hypothetical protein
MGSPSWRMDRRSGGKVKWKVDSIEVNSESVRPGRIGMLSDLRWSNKVLA